VSQRAQAAVPISDDIMLSGPKGGDNDKTMVAWKGRLRPPGMNWGQNEPNHIHEQLMSRRHGMAVTQIDEYEVMYFANTFIPRI